MIKHVSMKHGWFYYYRMHEIKCNMLLKEFPKLHDYLNDMFENCPHDFFVTGPRSSSLTFPIKNGSINVENHETCVLTDDALIEMEGRYKSAHSKVEVFMLEKDDKTIAVEVPIWIQADELKNFQELFETDEPLSGHIDILRVESGKIWVWDYKPKAVKEKHAHVQTLFYALMLSKRTGIELKNFMCGYFDENDCFVFKPEMDMIKFKY